MPGHTCVQKCLEGGGGVGGHGWALTLWYSIVGFRALGSGLRTEEEGQRRLGFWTSGLIWVELWDPP